MRDCEIVVLSRFPEIFEGFRESVDRDAPELRKSVIWDHATSKPVRPENWWSEQTGMPFQMARNGNTALKCAGNGDILYCSDDVRFIEPETVSRITTLANSQPQIGILSPKIIGHAQELQLRPTESPITYAPFVAFVLVFIKREVIDSIGYLDEGFQNYGHDDLDFCIRARLAGFKIAVAADISVKHGVDGHKYGSTFIRVRGENQMGEDDKLNRARFCEKWGISPEKYGEFLEHPW